MRVSVGVGVAAALIITALALLFVWRFFQRPVYQAPISIIRELDPTGPNASEAKELLDRTQLREARDILERSLVEHPSSAAAHYNLAVVCEAQGDVVAARRRYAEAIRLEPRHKQAKEALTWLGGW